MAKLDLKSFNEKAAKIKLVVFDVDGVLTDGKLYLADDGNEMKTFHARDGQGLVMLRDSGCEIGIITARKSNIVNERMSALGIKNIYQGVHNKSEAILNLMQYLKLEQEHVAYVGDDVIDLVAMQHADLRIAVADAIDEVKDYAHWVTEKSGGNGAAREVCEMILRGQGRYDEALQRYLPKS